MNKKHPTQSAHVLAENLKILGMSPEDFASHTGIPEETVKGVLAEEIPVTPEVAEKIALFFGGPDASMWGRLQRNFEHWATKNG